MEAAKQTAWAEAGIVIGDLKAALTDATEQLCKERAARDQLEEDMKKSFMRSVCAINLEVSCCYHHLYSTVLLLCIFDQPKAKAACLLCSEVLLTSRACLNYFTAASGTPTAVRGS